MHPISTQTMVIVNFGIIKWTTKEPDKIILLEAFKTFHGYLRHPSFSLIIINSLLQVQWSNDY